MLVYFLIVNFFLKYQVHGFAISQDIVRFLNVNGHESVTLVPLVENQHYQGLTEDILMAILSSNRLQVRSISWQKFSQGKYSRKDTNILVADCEDLEQLNWRMIIQTIAQTRIKKTLLIAFCANTVECLRKFIFKQIL